MSSQEMYDGLVPQSENTKLGVWFFLGSEIVFFTALILTFVLTRLRNPADFLIFKQHLSIPLVGLNTFILITSSYFVVRALESITHGDKKALRTNLMVVFILGALFVGGQVFEWLTLFGEGIKSRHNYG